MNSIGKCLEKLGYKKLTSLQKKAFDLIVKTSSSIIIVAPTGSGKTEAALFPIMYLIRKNKLEPVSAIYITPLRALNRDIVERIEKIGVCFNVSVALRHGDTPQSVRKAVLSNPPHILVTTPETFNYLLMNNEFLKYIRNTKFIVIDEFRELLESKRGYLLFTVIYLLEKYVLKRAIRKIALTATLKDRETASRILSGEVFSNTIVLSDDTIKKLEINVIIPNKTLNDRYGINKIVEDPGLSSRLSYIIDILNKHQGVLIFTNTRSLAERLGYLLSKITEYLGLDDIKIGVHHGSLSKHHRLSMEQGFKNGLIKGLVATSSMELGIDIGRVDYVVQYMSPRQVARLLQRIGRSGHKLGGVSRGCIITLENMFQALEAIVLTRRAYAYDLEVERIEKSPLDVLAYAIALFSLITNGFNKYDLYNKITEHVLYKDLDISTFNDLLEYLEYARIVKINGNIVKPTRRTKIYLYKVTMIPDTRNINVIEVSSGKKIGTLNEEYVVLNINPNDSIVLGGRVWRVVEYDHENAKLYVEQIEVEKETLIPHWEGENIPVEYKVAREVASIIRRIKENNSLEMYSFANEILMKYRDKAGQFGDDRTIVIDYNEELNIITINVYGGSRVNKFLRDLLKTVISNRYPFLDIHVYATPYAIFIGLPSKRYSYLVGQLMDTIEQVFMNLLKYIDFSIIREIASNQNTLYWRIYQVAQRFGAIDPKAGPVSKSILSGFIDTIIGYEALKEVVFKDYDLENVQELAMRIKGGKIRIVKRRSDKSNLFHIELLNYVEVPHVEALKPFDKELYREKILNRKITLICIRCGYLEHGRIRDFLGKSYYCPRCKLKTIAVVKGDGALERNIVLKMQRGEKLSRDEKKIIDDLRRRAILLIEHGEIALIALGARGVGSNDVSRIISRVRSGDDLYRILYEYEKRAIRAKKYLRRKH